MELGINGTTLIKKYEGCKLKAYLCPAGIPTIGYGSTYFKDGTKVKIGDTITQEQANELFLDIVKDFVEAVNHLVKAPINQNQFDALVSLCYNIGSGNLQKSSLLKKVNVNPSDTSISDSFKLWNKGGGKVLSGLVARRKAESELYFS